MLPLPGYTAVVCDVLDDDTVSPGLMDAVVPDIVPDVLLPGDDVSAADVPVVSAALVSTADDSVADCVAPGPVAAVVPPGPVGAVCEVLSASVLL